MATNRPKRVINLHEDIQPFKETRFYNARVRCTNCNHGGDIKIPKGLPIEGYPCPQCQCLRLITLPPKKK